ncbi:ATP-binding protein [Leptospira santarosai]|uniref:AAA domain protein n=1 Tax=Leptospira santarosai serovar Arenal str. MAVJ 401 TaxID=1049976 RepID=M6JMV0_9LEPT|nr:ATP-binding protein [Leptospira santarosai]EMN20915.1 AAA domain protein [Leptospira santarosai serovar Arenal str. MAVJ 401]
MAFVKATKEKSKLRAAMFGPAGAGKTFTSLSMGEGLGKKIAVIDSEKGSSAKYSDRFNFDISVLEDKSIDSYIQQIQEAGSLGYDVLIIDSGTHAWQELLDEVDRIAKSKFNGNSYAAWSYGTPKQKKLISALYDFPGHLIFTMRSKTEYILSFNDKGQQIPKRVGLAPEQGKGVEFEFDILFEMNVEHNATIIKDRTGKFQDLFIEKPGKVFGQALSDWLSVGIQPKPKENKPSSEKYRSFIDLIQKVQRATNLTDEQKKNELLRIKKSWEKIKDIFSESEIHFFNDGKNEILNVLCKYGWIEDPNIPEPEETGSDKTIPENSIQAEDSVINTTSSEPELVGLNGGMR